MAGVFIIKLRKHRRTVQQKLRCITKFWCVVKQAPSSAQADPGFCYLHKER